MFQVCFKGSNAAVSSCTNKEADRLLCSGTQSMELSVSWWQYFHKVTWFLWDMGKPERVAWTVVLLFHCWNSLSGENYFLLLLHRLVIRMGLLYFICIKLSSLVCFIVRWFSRMFWALQLAPLWSCHWRWRQTYRAFHGADDQWGRSFLYMLWTTQRLWPEVITLSSSMPRVYSYRCSCTWVAVWGGAIQAHCTDS